MKKAKYLISALIISILSVSLSGCACSKPVTPIEIIATTPTPANPAPTKAPTDSVAVTKTPVQDVTEAPVPTEEAKATATPIPEPTATNTPTPTTHAHEWTITFTDPTCTEDGIVVHTCECGETWSETLDKTGHTPGEQEITNPTLENEGKIIVRCTVCGEVLSEEILPKLTPTPTATNTPTPTVTSKPKPTATNTPTPTPTSSLKYETRKDDLGNEVSGVSVTDTWELPGAPDTAVPFSEDKLEYLKTHSNTIEEAKEAARYVGAYPDTVFKDEVIIQPDDFWVEETRFRGEPGYLHIGLMFTDAYVGIYWKWDDESHTTYHFVIADRFM